VRVALPTPRSLLGRVALSAALGALLSGSIVALVTIVLSSRLARTRDDVDLREVAGVLAYALTVKHYTPSHAALEQQQEHAHAGISVAVFERDVRAAGEAAIPAVAPGTCLDTGEDRACAVSAGKWTAVAARDRATLIEQGVVSTRAAGIAVVLTSLLSSLVALALAYAAVDPLKRLALAVERGDAALGEDVGVLEVDALRATLQSAFDRQARALAQSRSFAEHAAHKLRDPLATIVAQLERGADLGDERSRARRVAARLSALVEHLLILASPHDTVSVTTVMSVRAALDQAIETLPDALRSRVVCRGGDVTIHTEPVLLVSAIVSALENALKYSSGTVLASVEPQAGMVTLAIEDDGPGVSQAEREQVFLPFYRGRDARARRTPGHGIGLAVIARVAQVHGGTARFGERARGARLEMTFATDRS
jgi:signal transduction histidine kinase